VGEADEDSIDLRKTKQVLDADHSGLEKVKDRVLEYLAVRKLNPDVKGPILCFLGPRASARRRWPLDRELDRPQVRAGFARRHARRGEIRGHRRTYIGALPGRSSRASPRRIEEPGLHPRRDRQARLGLPRRPASALLEVLDPEQNNSFRDHYLDVPFDLSRCCS
jgi:ATP-dependent Lon protease